VPTRISANLQSGVVEVDGKADSRIRAAKDGNRIEIAIPFAALGKSDRGFYVNLTRERDKQITFWRGNPMSIQDPVSYANFVLD
jgi:hypothetical protein